MGVPNQHNRPHSRNLLLLLFRSFLHWLIKSIVLVFLAIRKASSSKVARLGFLALLATCALGWYLLNNTFKGGQSVSNGASIVSVQASQLLPPHPEVERYLKAQANYDAKGMWDAISQDLKTSMQQGSTSPVQELQTELDAAKQQGRVYRSAVYVGGVPTRDGMSVYFYVLTVDGPGGTVDVPYIYVLGRDGKIVSIQ